MVRGLWRSLQWLRFSMEVLKMSNKLYNLGDVFKDSWDPKFPWRVQLPKGRMPCKTKRDALRISQAVTETIQALRSREVE